LFGRFGPTYIDGDAIRTLDPPAEDRLWGCPGEGMAMSRPALVLVDHEASSRTHLRERIAAVCPSEIELLVGETAEEGLGILYTLRDQQRPVEILIVRQSLPGMPGTRLLEIVAQQFPAVTKILLSARPSLDEAIFAFNNTGLDKYIPLPWESEDIKFTITALLRQRQMKQLNERLLGDLQVRNQELTVALQSLQQARHDLEHSYIQTVESLAVALEAKDRYTSGHSQRVARFSRLIARSLGLPKEEVEIIAQVALLHDIGKIGMLDKILNKPANLTPEERETIKAHPVVGAQILGPVVTFQKHLAGIKHHHEMYDGSGYPDGLKGTGIPLAARIVCLADAFDAMTSTRPYRVGLPIDYAVQEMKKMSGRQFCPDCVEAFVRVLTSSGVVDEHGTGGAADPPAATAVGSRG
jgi:cyclic di-GMP phosphodiesterase